MNFIITCVLTMKVSGLSSNIHPKRLKRLHQRDCCAVLGLRRVEVDIVIHKDYVRKKKDDKRWLWSSTKIHFNNLEMAHVKCRKKEYVSEEGKGN